MIAFMAARAFLLSAAWTRGRSAFTIKTMVIQAKWPGASARVTRQVTKGSKRNSRSWSRSTSRAAHRRRPDHDLRQSACHHEGARSRTDLDACAQHGRRHQGDFPRAWSAGLQRPVRRCLRQYLRLHERRPFQRQLRDRVEDVRAKGAEVPNVGRVDIVGHRTRSSILEFSTEVAPWPRPELDPVFAAAQNAISSGVLQAGPERNQFRVNGQFTSEESLKAIIVNDRFFPLTDVARSAVATPIRRRRCSATMARPRSA